MFGDVLQQTSYVWGRSTADIVCLGTFYSRHRMFGNGLQQTSYVWERFTADIVNYVWGHFTADIARLGTFYSRHCMFMYVLQQISYICEHFTADIVYLGTFYSRHRMFGNSLQQTAYFWERFTALCKLGDVLHSCCRFWRRTQTLHVRRCYYDIQETICRHAHTLMFFRSFPLLSPFSFSGSVHSPAVVWG